MAPAGLPRRTMLIAVLIVVGDPCRRHVGVGGDCLLQRRVEIGGADVGRRRVARRRRGWRLRPILLLPAGDEAREPAASPTAAIVAFIMRGL